MFEEHIWDYERFDHNVQEGMDLVRSRVLFLVGSDGERTHAIVPYIGWLALAYLRADGIPANAGEQGEMIVFQDGQRELRIPVGTPPDAIAAAIRAFYDK